MPEYIEREAVLNELNRNSITKKITLANGVSIFDKIKNLPTADVVEVKHGEWEEVQQVGRNSRHIKYTTKKCSVCGYWNGRRKTNYCPNCGAKMDLKEGDDR